MDRLPCCMLFDVLSCTDPTVVTQFGGTCRLLRCRISGETNCRGSQQRGLRGSIDFLWRPLPQPPVHYIDAQPHITHDMRFDRVEWISNILGSFDAPCSVYDHAIDMLDAHLSQHVVRREEITNVCCAVMGAALGQWGESSARAAGTRPAIRLDDLARAMLVLKTQAPCMDALELLHLPGPYDCWTRLAVLISDNVYSIEQVHQMQVLVAGSGWHWLSRPTTSFYARRFAQAARLPWNTARLALSFGSYMLFDLVFRRWSPEVRGAASAILAVLCSKQHCVARRSLVDARKKSRGAFTPLGALRHWWQRGPYTPSAPEGESSCTLQAVMFESEHLHGLPCCVAALVRFMERASNNGLLHRATARKDLESAEYLCQVQWENLMAEVVNVFQGEI